ncbi:hypothetical protein B0H14DRAFT_2567964 [Mycena olivaceomarginata]|nr:hypothetical protein B0H14DRAFT_2567964 [Mycena olivaceomarginata]
MAVTPLHILEYPEFQGSLLYIGYCISDNSGPSTRWTPMWIHISRWQNVVPLPLRSRMCTLIELVKAVDEGTSTERTMDQLYIVQFLWSEHIFLAFKGLDSRLHHLEALIDAMTHSLLRKRPKKQQCMQNLDGLRMAQGGAVTLLLLVKDALGNMAIKDNINSRK